MPKPKNVVIQVRGNLATLRPVDLDIKRLFAREMMYRRRMSENNQYWSEDRRCFEVIPDDDYGEQLIFATGHLQRVRHFMQQAGRQLRIVNLGPRPDPQLYLPAWDRVADVKFRWQQRETLERLLKFRYAQVRCPVGFGKSFMIGVLCRLLPHANIVISTFARDVLTQLHAEVSKQLPFVGLIRAGKRLAGRRVHCVGLKSLANYEGNCDLLIVDEVHEFGTDANLELLGSLPQFANARRYGFSANVGDRTDQGDFETEGAFGPCVVSLDYEECLKHGCVVPLKILWRDVCSDRLIVSPDWPLWKREKYGIWQNELRNQLIAADAKSFGTKQVLITVSTLEHAAYLKQLLPEYTLCYADSQSTTDKAAALRRKGLLKNEPPMTAARRQKLKQDFESGKLRHVIATSVWNRGVDFKPLQVLIRADARADRISGTQIPGRTSRVSDGKEAAVIVDYRDQFDSGFARRAQFRSVTYRQHGWEQLQMPNSHAVQKAAKSWLK